jgi:hypothetical protein
MLPFPAPYTAKETLSKQAFMFYFFAMRLAYSAKDSFLDSHSKDASQNILDSNSLK